MTTDWAKVSEVEHRYSGKDEGKHDESNKVKLTLAERQENEYETNTELRLKKEKMEGTEEMPVQENKAEDSDAKPSHSYIALIAMAILSRPSKKVLLGDIYNYISDKFPYYRSKDKSWRNSIRHNLSLNECFIKAGRSENGKGNYWAIHPANLEDFANGDFRRRRARRRVKKSHSTLCTRYSTLPFQHHPQAFALNYRSAEFYHHPFYIAPLNVQNCVRKNSFAIDSLLASRVPGTALANPTALRNPVEYSPVNTAPLCSSALLRGYSTGTPYSSLTSPGNHTMAAYPALAYAPNSQVPSESWHDTWKKLKAQFQTQSA